MTDDPTPDAARPGLPAGTPGPRAASPDLHAATPGGDAAAAAADHDDALDRELELRLRADARDDDGHAPPFEVALDRASAPRSPVRWIAAAAAVIVLAGGAVTTAVLTSGDGGSGPAAVGASVSGVPPRQGKNVLQHLPSAGFEGVFAVKGDPRALDVVIPHSTEPGACSVFEPQVTVVAQTPRDVRLRVSGYSYLPKPKPGQQYVGFSCFQGTFVTMRVHLAAPLGTRAVHDDDAKETIAVTDPSDFPAPSFLPSGFTPDRVEPPDAATGTVSGTRSYVNGAGWYLEIITGGIPSEPTDGPIVYQIAGRPVRLVDGENDRCVVWTTPGGAWRSVCVSGAKPLLGVDALITVAAGLH